MISLKSFERAPYKARTSKYDELIKKVLELETGQAWGVDVPGKEDARQFRGRLRIGINNVVKLRMGEKAPKIRVDLSKDMKSVAVSVKVPKAKAKK
jgi:hypothetical protein